MSDPVILAFDTSGPYCAAAVLKAGQLTTKVEDMSRGQGERLMGLLEDILAQTATRWGDLNGIGVGTGPGNFTGIRISVSAARGLALGLGIPAIGVSGFEAAAFDLKNVVACLPAPREHAYVQAFIGGGDRAPALVDLATLKDLPFFSPKAEARFCGPAGEDVARAYFGGVANPTDVLPQPVPTIDAIARIAIRRVHSTKDRPKPLYVRAADAAPPREKPPVILP